MFVLLKGDFLMEEIVIEKAELGAKSAIEKEESMVPMFEEITPHKMTVIYIDLFFRGIKLR